MGLFRSRRRADDLDDELDAGSELDDDATVADGPDTDDADDQDADEAEEAPRVVPHPQGPWDLDDLPDDDDRERLDLGGLRIFVPENVELRVDLDQNSQVVAATMVHDEEIMQLGAFAAPRTEPIWDEIRAEIAESVSSGGGSFREVEGPFGTELIARVPTDQPGVFAPARFLGINGPRWFLRALVSGPKSADGIDDPLLFEALRAVVVVRGADAMAPRDGLPLRLPKDAQANAEAAIAAATAQSEQNLEPGQGVIEADASEFLSIPERGPEITEIG